MERQGAARAAVDGPGQVAKGPSPRAVLAALTRLLASDQLRTSTRSRDFLAYVVTETLAGRGDRLKERTVARYALGRGGDIDTTTNATARVQATRLRASMQRYYAGAGAGESVVIELPRGSYVPTFSYRRSPVESKGASPLRPGIAVTELADLRPGERGDLVPRALTDALIRALSAFPELRIVGHVVTERGVVEPLDARAVARSFEVEYVLVGAVRSTEEVLRLTVRLCDGATGEVVWSEQYDQERGALGGFGDEDDVVRRVAATVGDVRGVVQREVERFGAHEPDDDARAALLAFYRFAESGTEQDTATAEEALALALESRPDDLRLLTMAGWVQCVQGIMGWTAGEAEVITSAEGLARRALALDPASAHAHQVLAGVALSRGQEDQCRSLALRTVDLNPANSSLLYTSGALLLQVDEWEAGIEMIREASRINPYHPGYHHVFLAMDRLLAGDDAGALAETSLLHRPDDLWGPLLRCLALAGLGYEEDARRELQAALVIEPRLLDDEAAYVTEELRDAPARARAELRRRLLRWTSPPAAPRPGARG